MLINKVQKLAELIKLAPGPLTIVRVVLAEQSSGAKHVQYGVATYRLDLTDSLKPIARWQDFVSGPTRSYDDAVSSARDYACRHQLHWHYTGRFGVIDERVAALLVHRIATDPMGQVGGLRDQAG